MKVVVTGGSGFVGKRLQLVKPDWIYLSSKDLDLTNYEKTVEYLKKEKLVENGIISEFLLREIEQAARSVVRGAQLQILTDDMLSLTKKEDSK